MEFSVGLNAIEIATDLEVAGVLAMVCEVATNVDLDALIE